MKSSAQSLARRNINLNLLVSSVETFQTKLIGENFNIFSLKMKKLLRWVMQSKAATSGKLSAVLESKAEGLKAASLSLALNAHP